MENQTLHIMVVTDENAGKLAQWLASHCRSFSVQQTKRVTGETRPVFTFINPSADDVSSMVHFIRNNGITAY